MIPVVLSGGAGSRLWPLSRARYPKQFLRLFGEDSLFQGTLKRLEAWPAMEPAVVVCNAGHRFLVGEQLQERGLAAQAILLEPVGRNTAPAIAVAALEAARLDPESLLLVLPADHQITDTDAFHEAVHRGTPCAERGALVTFGVVPNVPETGYGYIQVADRVTDQPLPVAAFVEKPDARRAKEFVDGGMHLWNSGMFLLRADRYLAELRQHATAVFKAAEEAYSKARRDLDFTRLDEAAFRRSPDISIDYAVMERTQEAVVVPLDAGWSDIGSWDTLASVGDRDDADNQVIGDAVLEDVQNSYIRAEDRLVAAIGLDHHIIVETKDAVLVADRSRAQSVKRIVERLKAEGRTEQLFHRRVFRPWGWYEGMVLGSRFQVKHICVKPGASLSLQLHHHRAEHWVVVQGTAEVVCGERTFLLSEDQSTYIPLGHRHRLTNPGQIPLELIEVQTGSYLGEDDIVRFADDYGRDAPAQVKS